jgi:hypothetical protein
MADLNQIPKPSRKGEPPTPTSSANNLAKPAETGVKAPLQLKISPAVRREFKGYALARDMDASELFMRVWDFYKEHQG